MLTRGKFSDNSTANAKFHIVYFGVRIFDVITEDYYSERSMGYHENERCGLLK